MLTSKFTSLIQSKSFIKRLFARSSKPTTSCPPKEKKICDCPPPNLHKECRDEFSNDILSQGSAEHTEADFARKKWRIITLFVCLPVIIACTLSTLVMDDSEHRRPPYVEYEYMYRRERPFPWGDGKKSFFHNPCLNAVPGVGYEDDKCEKHHKPGEGAEEEVTEEEEEPVVNDGETTEEDGETTKEDGETTKKE